MKFLLILLSLLCVNARAENKMFVGVQLDINTGSISPYFDVRISKSYPTRTNRFEINEMHHGYVGIGILTAGIITKSKLLQTVGIVLVVDDTVQHTFRVNTPVHMLNDELWRYKWYRTLQDKVI